MRTSWLRCVCMSNQAAARRAVARGRFVHSPLLQRHQPTCVSDSALLVDAVSLHFGVANVPRYSLLQTPQLARGRPTISTFRTCLSIWMASEFWTSPVIQYP
jgi:hypothetical protein